MRSPAILLCVSLATCHHKTSFVQTFTVLHHSRTSSQGQSKAWRSAIFESPKRVPTVVMTSPRETSSMDGINIIQSSADLPASSKSIDVSRKSSKHFDGEPPDLVADNIEFDTKLLLDFERNGHVAVRNLFSRCPGLGVSIGDIQKAVDTELIANQKEAYQQKMRLFAEDDDDEALLEASSRCTTAAEAKAALEAWCEENDCPVPFLQLFNMHRGASPAAHAILALAASPSMGRIAAALLGVDGVRLYQTSAFHKAPARTAPRRPADAQNARPDPAAGESDRGGGGGGEGRRRATARRAGTRTWRRRLSTPTAWSV